MSRLPARHWLALLFAVWIVSHAAVPAGPHEPQEIHDLVITGGRVMDPESGLDAVRNIAISGGVIRASRRSPP